MVAAAFWVLVHPDNPLTRLFRREIVDTGGKVVVGPYPVEKDFRLLSKRRISTIVSLLNPQITYEGVLLNREKILAQGYGIEVLDFPMTSVLGRRFGSDYDENARRAVDAIENLQGRAYLHCYLGMHRAQVVTDLLEKKGVRIGRYLVREGERSAAQLAVDQAYEAFHAGRNEEVLAILAPPNDSISPAQALKGWVQYRMGDAAAAKASFLEAARLDGKNMDALDGLGYVQMSTGDLEGAAKSFSAVLAATPKDASALAGLGFARSRQGRSSEAAGLFEKSLKIDPGNVEARRNLENLRKK